MDLASWKRFKRSGTYKRKAKQKLKQSQSMPGDLERSEVSVENSEVGSVDTKIEITTEPCSSNQDDLFVTNNFDNNGEDEEIKISDDSETSETSDNEVEDEDNVFRDNIKKWAVQFNIPHNSLKNLLEILNRRLPYVLPNDPRTLLKTDTDIQIQPMGTGFYWHNGLEKSLIEYLKNTNNIPQKISLNINIDGLPISKSSKSQLWPILCNVHEIPQLHPIVIGIYSGYSKPPNVKTFLRLFVDEMKQLLENGVVIKNETDGTELKVLLTIRAFICDSPARAFIKGVCNFNAKDGCQKCTVHGEYSHISHTVFFPKVGCPKRTDKDFRERKYDQHHKEDSPLLDLPVDMIEDIIVGDSLHLIDLGIMKRLLTSWRDGKYSNNYDTKWCSQKIAEVTNYLLGCKMPKEIHRSFRGLSELCHWKGSEFRSFLYYFSFIILEDTLQADVFQHFLCLFCAITIMSNENYFHLLELAKSMLDHFVLRFKNIYGKDYITSNVHNLTHVVDEVKRFGKLQNFSAYPFENKLYTLKKTIRQGNNPLAQVARRISEISNVEITSANSKKEKFPFVKHSTSELHLEGYVLTSLPNNKWFFSKEDHVIEIMSLNSSETGITIRGYRLEPLDNVFENPIKSSYLNIYKCDIKAMKKTAGIYTPDMIKCKLVSVEYKSNKYFVPLLHTL